MLYDEIYALQEDLSGLQNDDGDLPHAVSPLAKFKREFVDLQARDIQYLFRLNNTESPRITWTKLLPNWSHILTKYRPSMLTTLTLTTIRTDGVDGSTQLLVTRSDRFGAKRGVDLLQQKAAIERSIRRRRHAIRTASADATSAATKESAEKTIELIERALSLQLHPYGQRSYMKNVVNALVRRRSLRADADLLALMRHYATADSSKKHTTGDKKFGMGKIFDAATEIS